jgi:hypothetical protein
MEATMARSVQQQLDDVDAAIAAIERGAQEFVTPAGVSFKRGQLSALYEQRTRLQGEVSLSNLPGEVPAMMPVALGRIS